MDTRLLRSLPYLRPAQFLHRAQRLATQPLLVSRLGAPLARRWSEASTEMMPELSRSPREELWVGRDAEGAEILGACAAGRFEFLGLARDLGDPVSWEDPTVPRLWRFTLNYFGFAWPLALCGEAGGRELARLVDDWCRRTGAPHRGDAWHPYVVAERLLNLFGTRSAWSSRVADPDAVLRSLAGQARYLRWVVERDIGGNHVVREAAALVVAGDALRDRELRGAGVRLAQAALRRQILGDGMHEERSPSYHLEVLMDLVEIRRLMPDGVTLAVALDAVLPSMAAAARAMRHPDASLPRFNDTSAWPVDPADLLRRLGLSGSTPDDLPDAGYFRLSQGRDLMIVDAGAPAPRDLPPHAHCDMLSFELSVGDVPLLVNSGTGDYEAGPWRDYWRGTRAHNTVEVDGQEQSEVWGSFRMARRAGILDVAVRRSAEQTWFRAAHDGYSRLPDPVTHRRTIEAREGVWFVLDELGGTGQVRARSFLHRHPDARFTAERDGFTVERGDVRATILPVGPLPLTHRPASEHPVANWSACRLGDRTESSALVLEGRVELPATIGWVMSSTGPLSDAAVTPGSGGPAVSVRHGDRVVRMDGSAGRRAGSG